MTREEALNEIKSWDFLEGKEIEAIETLIPELAGSEDERILASIADCVGLMGEDGNVFSNHNVTKAQVLSWLEKQKEQKRPEFCNGHCADCELKEQKPAEWNDTDMKEARANLISVCMDWERGKQTTLLPIVAVRARYFLEHLTEPKPAEWSEEDEHRRTDAIYFLESAKSHYADTSEIEKTILWLQSLSSNLKKKNEDVAKLCSNEWSEEDEEKLKAICTYLRGYSRLAKLSDKLRFNEYCDFLKSLHPSWKPTEHQMTILKAVKEYVGKGSGYWGEGLGSLIDDLEKL